MKTMIQTHLEQFGYDYTDHGEMLTVRLGFSLHVVIDLSEPDKIRLIDRLKSWNCLTGIIETRLKGAPGLQYHWFICNFTDIYLSCRICF